MSRIKILSEVVASQIAAGEVVQRPASVVKELIENSLDAGAGRITVEVERGGNDLIRVVDDGCGMDKEDLPVALRRHATSKIELESDLLSIQTHGFRGEALAAISSVSKTEIVSRPQGERQGHRLYAEGGEIVSLEPAGCPPGTAITVSELFYNTPARKKFMKAASTEIERVGDVLLRTALCNPHLHLELSHNGRRSRHYPPVPSAADRMIQVLGANLTGDLLPVDYSNDRIQIVGFASRPTTHRKTAGDLYFFVNKRFIRDKILMRALIEAYRASLPQRRYPVVALFLTLPCDQVDVNVHPAKEEIRFIDERMVWRSVYTGLRETLAGFGERTWIGVEEDLAGEELVNSSSKPYAPPLAPQPRPTQFDFDRSLQDRPRESSPPEKDEAGSAEAPSDRERIAPSEEDLRPPRERKEFLSDPFPSPYRDPSDLPRKVEEMNRRPLAPPIPSHRDSAASSPDSGPGRDNHQRWRVVAQVFDSFVVCERGEEMALFDQHALHERIQFEKLRRQYEAGAVDQQTLMFPMTLEIAPRQVEVLEGSLDLLSQLGLEMESFGDCTFIVRTIPADLKLSEVEGLVSEALEDLADQGMVSPLSDRAEKVLARMACRSAIKANERLERTELQHLIDQYSTNPILSTCPHGRPPIWKISRKEMEKLFDRP
jgi:DNA mismatch repair protein MutL